MASSWSRRRWISGAWICEDRTKRETFAVREARCSERGAARADAAAYCRRTAARAAGSAEDASNCAHCPKPETGRGIYAYGERYRSDDHSERRTSARNQAYPGKSENAAARRGECCPLAADEPGRIADSGRVLISRTAVLGYLLSPKHQLKTRPEQTV